MNVLPVIVRELRAEARNPYNWRLQVSVAALAILYFGWNAWMTAMYLRGGWGGRFTADGQELFTGLQFIVFGAICLVSPILTADCLGREKREGTLGLLFLTPLTAMGTVFAKSAIHALRALCVVLVVLGIQGLVALWAWLQLNRRLRQRDFVVNVS